MRYTWVSYTLSFFQSCIIPTIHTQEGPYPGAWIHASSPSCYGALLRQESGWVIVKGAVSERTAAQGDWRVLPHLSSKERVLLRLRRRLRCRGLRGIGTHAGRGKVPEAEATGVGWKTRIGFEVDFWPKKMWARPDFKCTFVRCML